MTTPVSALTAPSPTESTILSVVSSSLGCRLAPEHVLSTLALLGVDSLAIIEIAAAIERALGVAIPQELVHESTTIQELAGWVDARRARGSGHIADPDPTEQMIADSQLPGDVRPRGTDPEPRLVDSRSILLTGGTGFLGGRLAADLLAQSRATLYCTVRGSEAGGRERLRGRLLQNGVTADVIDGRVHVVEADLARPHLGLSHEVREVLGGTIDAVLHAGASVNWVASYPALRAANVLGTLELLRFASRDRGIPFHFISSLSVCYAEGGPSEVDESFDPLPHLRSVHLGYARTKVVAEALVREAGRRGLPVRIYRPALISGHSRTGAFNPDDLLSLLVRGCVRMGTAPDLDWVLDCLPVDVVSGAILSLSSGSDRTTHLTHHHPRHWRECLLWMRLAGYPVRLVPYADWLRQLVQDTLELPDHPLRLLRSFFLSRSGTGLTLPELYEEGRRSRATGARTDARIAGVVRRPPLDASLLECYFAAYRESGYLPVARPRQESAVRLTPAFDAAFFQRVLSVRGGSTKVHAARCLSVGSAHSIIGELTAWHSQQPAGVSRHRLEVEAGGRRHTRDVVLKLKPHGAAATAVGEALARLCDARIGDSYARWSDRLGLADSHVRERGIYESADEHAKRHMPVLLGAADLDAGGACALVIEDLSGSVLIDSVDRTPWWTPEQIEIAVEGLADVHAGSYAKTSALKERLSAGFVHSTRSMTEMSDLWAALAEHAAPAFGAWGGAGLPALHQRLVDTIAVWRPVADEGPHALIHNDCNPRNICLRERGGRLSLCAYDWELATPGLPQRDLAELLCFVLPDTVPDAAISGCVERHRRLLEEGTGFTLDPTLWHRGFSAALNELLVTRLPMYALVHRVRRQAYLPRVVASWQRLHRWATGAAR